MVTAPSLWIGTSYDALCLQAAPPNGAQAFGAHCSLGGSPKESQP